MPPDDPWDQRLARVLVRPLARTPLRPNHITTLSLALAVLAGALFARGEGTAAVAAAVFVLARFIDHADGELARLTGRSSPLGYYYDFVTGGLSSAALFTGIAVAYWSRAWGGWALALGLAASMAALVAMAAELAVEARRGVTASPYPRLGPFELEDGIYLLAPITWLGGLAVFFTLACLGQLVFCAVKLRNLMEVAKPGAPEYT